MRHSSPWPKLRTVSEQFPLPPRPGTRHLYAVARYDSGSWSDPTEAFVLTRGYWDEAEAQEQANRMNASANEARTRYFVLVVRVRDES
jgi:hypothetical protein